MIGKKNKLLSGECGFTLLELIITMAAFAVIGIVILTILTSTLRGVNKANVIANVRQNGDYVLTTMSREIQEAISLQNPSMPCGDPTAPTTTTTIQATAIDNSTVEYQCTGNSIKDVNNADLVDTNTVVVSNCSFTCSQDSTSESPVIQIQFTLTPKTAGSVEEQTTTPVSFQTSVVMQNINR